MSNLITWDPNIILGIKAGTYNLSTPPLITDVNAATGCNQIINEINRRRLLLGHGTITYVSNDTRITATKINSLKTMIDTIRSDEYLSVFPWVMTYTANTRITASHFIELQQALDTDHIFLETSGDPTGGDNYLHKADSFYPPVALGGGSADTAGQRYSAPTYHKYRSYRYFTTPEDLTYMRAVGGLNQNTITGSGYNVLIYLTDHDIGNDLATTEENWNSLYLPIYNGYPRTGLFEVDLNLFLVGKVRRQFVLTTTRELNNIIPVADESIRGNLDYVRLYLS
jgi:hypothetical protein